MYIRNMVTCEECGCELSAQNALGYHLRAHGISYPEYVVKHQCGGDWPKCTCGDNLPYKKGGFPQFCSRSCASSGTNNAMAGRSGENSPIFGRKRTEEQKKNYSEGAKKRWQLHGDKLREMMKTDEYRKANSEGQVQSYIKDPTLKKKRSESVRRFWAESPLAGRLRQEASERAIQLLSENKIGPQAPYKAEWVMSPWTGKQEYMHSSWETAFFQTCVARRYEVTKNHGIVIPYIHPDGTVHSYIPDFYAPEDRTLYEMKGRYDEVDIAKWEAAQRFCEDLRWNFTVMLGPEVDSADSFDNSAA